MFIPYRNVRSTINRKRIHLTIGLGCEVNPDETVKRKLRPFLGVPYIKYESTWYVIKNDLGMEFDELLVWLNSNNYSEEILLEKVFKLIF